MKDDRKVRSTLIKADLGENADLKCLTEGHASWYYMPTEELPKQKPFTHYRKIIKNNMSMDDAGYYYCLAYSYVDKPFLARSELRVYS